MAINLISLGSPMILMGDEIARSQQGNNNSYCQDNTDFWFNWDNINNNKELFRFTKALIAQRTTLEAVHLNKTKRASLHDIIAQSGIRWHGVKVNEPDWSEHSHAIAMESKQPTSKHVTYVVFNAYWQDLNFELPTGTKWKLAAHC